LRNTSDAPFPGMLVLLYHSHTPECNPDHVRHQYETAINSFLNPTNLPVSTFDSLTWHPPPLLPVCPLVVFANTLDSLLLQLMKATVLAKSSLFIYFHQALSAPVMSTDISQKGGRSHPSFLKYFY